MQQNTIWSVPFVLGLFLLFSASLLAEEDHMPVEELESGMEGYGLTVFEGKEVEEFGVELIDVVPDYFPGQDMIVIEVDHEVTDHAKVIGGMSGSPIYFYEDQENMESPQLAGALSYRLSAFPKDPIAGVTPIKNMVDARVFGEDRSAEQEGDMNRQGWHPEQDQEGEENFQRLSPLVTVSGVPNSVFEEYREDIEEYGFKPVQGGSGAGLSDKDLTIEPGSAGGILLMDGDIQFGSTGTVTDVNGDKVLMFGHAFFGAGKVEMPMTTSWVHTVLASQSNSVKLASNLNEVGTIKFDHDAAVGGTLGEETVDMIPFDISVTFRDGAVQNTYSTRMVPIPDYSPMLVGMAVSSALTRSAPSQFEDVVTEHELVVETENHGTLKFSNATLGWPTFTVRGVVNSLMNTPFEEELNIRNINLDMDVESKGDRYQISSVWLETRHVKPGETVGLHVRYTPIEGDPVHEQYEFDIPESLASGEYDLRISPGNRAPTPTFSPDTLEEYVNLLQRDRRSDQLAISLKLPNVTVTTGGRELPNLPPSLTGAFAGDDGMGVRLQNEHKTELFEAERVLSGASQIRIEIE